MTYVMLPPPSLKVVAMGASRRVPYVPSGTSATSSSSRYSMISAAEKVKGLSYCQKLWIEDVRRAA
jgi:hypothetical protein